MSEPIDILGLYLFFRSGLFFHRRSFWLGAGFHGPFNRSQAGDGQCVSGEDQVRVRDGRIRFPDEWPEERIFEKRIRDVPKRITLLDYVRGELFRRGHRLGFDWFSRGRGCVFLL